MILKVMCPGQGGSSTPLPGAKLYTFVGHYVSGTRAPLRAFSIPASFQPVDAAGRNECAP